MLPINVGAILLLFGPSDEVSLGGSSLFPKLLFPGVGGRFAGLGDEFLGGGNGELEAATIFGTVENVGIGSLTTAVGGDGCAKIGAIPEEVGEGETGGPRGAEVGLARIGGETSSPSSDGSKRTTEQ